MSPSKMFLVCVCLQKESKQVSTVCLWVHVLGSFRRAGDIGGGGVVPLVGHTLLCL